jgi:hypothetical protein
VITMPVPAEPKRPARKAPDPARLATEATENGAVVQKLRRKKAPPAEASQPQPERAKRRLRARKVEQPTSPQTRSSDELAAAAPVAVREPAPAVEHIVTHPQPAAPVAAPARPAPVDDGHRVLKAFSPEPGRGGSVSAEPNGSVRTAPAHTNGNGAAHNGNGTAHHGKGAAHSGKGNSAVAAPSREPHKPAGRRVDTSNAPTPKKRTARTPQPEQVKTESGLELRPNEVVLHEMHSWSRLRPARLIITNYRVALVSRPAKPRWIPLEQVDGARVGRVGTPILIIDGSIERLTLQSFKGKALRAFCEILNHEADMARAPGAWRHDPGLMQEWADRSGDLWDSQWGRVRLWVRRHPIMLLILAASIVGLGKVYGS